MKVGMRVFVCNDFTGYWPVGTAAVVVADDEVAARGLLAQALRDKKLDDGGFTLTEVDTGKAAVRILNDGDY